MESKENNDNYFDRPENKNFVNDILKGNNGNLSKLKNWYYSKNNNELKKNENKLYNVIIELCDGIVNDNKDLKPEKETSSSNNVNNNFFKKMEERLSKIEEKNNNLLLIIDQQNKEINDQKKEINDQKIDHLSFRITQFWENTNNLLTQKELALTTLKVEYLDKIGTIHNIQIEKLVYLINELYSFRNIFIYRKIVNLLLEQILILYKNNLCIKENKKGVKKILVIKSVNTPTNLQEIINFFFFIKKNASNILHILRISQNFIKELNTCNTIDISDINNLKDINTIFTELKKNCTYQSLIETMKYKLPLMFFKLKNNFLDIDDITKNIKNQIKEIDKQRSGISSNYFERVKGLNEESKIIIIKIKELEYGESNILEKFNKGCNILKNENKKLETIEKFEVIKMKIINNLDGYVNSREKVKGQFFSFLDFVKIYNKVDETFDPYNICMDLLHNVLKSPVDIFKDDIDDFVKFFEEKLN